MEQEIKLILQGISTLRHQQKLHSLAAWIDMSEQFSGTVFATPNKLLVLCPHTVVFVITTGIPIYEIWHESNLIKKGFLLQEICEN